VAKQTGVKYEEATPKPKEDLEKKFRYIESLPFTEVRNVALYVDDKGYYITWPNRAYYKHRLFNPGSFGKYLSPSGHAPPLFWARQDGNPTLVMVEGEINALSIAKACRGVDVCSPGSSSLFKQDKLKPYLHLFEKYRTLDIVVDDDEAGIKALIEAKGFFKNKIPFINGIRMMPDANEVLIGQGTGALRRILQRENCG
jgi:hypothetical protein